MAPRFPLLGVNGRPSQLPDCQPPGRWPAQSIQAREQSANSEALVPDCPSTARNSQQVPVEACYSHKLVSRRSVSCPRAVQFFGGSPSEQEFDGDLRNTSWL